MIAPKSPHPLVSLGPVEEEDIAQMATREFFDEQHPEVLFCSSISFLHIKFLIFPSYIGLRNLP